MLPHLWGAFEARFVVFKGGGVDVGWVLRVKSHEPFLTSES